MTQQPCLDDIPEIDDWSACDGEAICCFMRDMEGELGWHWVAIDDLLQYGRPDIVETFFPDAGWNIAA